MTANKLQNSTDSTAQTDPLAEVVIVGTGAVLPGSYTPAEFYDDMLRGQTRVTDLTKLTDNSHRHFVEPIVGTRETFGKSYTSMGAPIDRTRIAEMGEAMGLPLQENFISHIMAIEAVRQAVQHLPQDAKAQTDFMFGFTSPASEGIRAYFDKAQERIEKAGGAALKPLLQQERDRDVQGRANAMGICTLLSEKVRRTFDLGGACLLADAACASSLAALLPAVLRLREGRSRYAIVGGGDECLGCICPLISFSHLGVLSDKPPIPLDKASDGMVIGEGAVAFLLTTRAEAERAGLPVLAVIKGIGASSDGKSGGMTEPTLLGQLACYERAYEKGAPPAMAYIEAHGTGTKVGDRVEMNSLMRFFAGQSTPIGSAKWHVGHTMGAAGATGMLRAIGVMQRGQVPPAPYFEEYPIHDKIALTMPTTAIPLNAPKGPMNVGVSSFGFGGSNYHVWLQQPGPTGSAPTSSAMPAPQHDVVLCAESEADIKDVAALFRLTNYRLPPKAWPFIDKIQLLAVLLGEKLFRDHAIGVATLDRTQMHVITGSTHPLELQREISERQMITYLLGRVSLWNPERAAEVQAVEATVYDDLVEMNDQSILGAHTCLTASRVTKAFDFRGMNFNVDADYASGLMAMECARSILRAYGGAALVYDVVKEVDADNCYLTGKAMKVSLLASAEYAQQHSLPIKAVVQPLEIERVGHAA